MEFIEIILLSSIFLVVLNKYNKIDMITCFVVILSALFVHNIISTNNTQERFENSSSGKVVNTSGTDHSIFDQDMFSDVKVFDTKLVDNEVAETGIQICLQKCEGFCTEYGVSGRGLCYPYNWTPQPRSIDTSGSN